MNRPLLRLAWSCIAGRSHAATGKGCEDAAGGVHLGRRGGMVALADGAGSARHAAIGAATTVAVALAAAAEILDECPPTVEPLRILTPIHKALEMNAEELSCTLADLAATLLVVAAKRHEGQVAWFAAHMGDGVIAADFGAGTRLLSSPENGEFGNCTYFVTDRHAPLHLRVYSGIAPEATFLLMSDGTAESLFRRHDQSLAPAVSHLLAWSRELTSRALKRVLTRNLKELIRPRTMDDVGIALLRVDGQGDGRHCMPMPP